MKEKETSTNPAITAAIADAHHAWEFLTVEQRHILNGIYSETLALVFDGKLSPIEIMQTIKEKHPEAVEALDALGDAPELPL